MCRIWENGLGTVPDLRQAADPSGNSRYEGRGMGLAFPTSGFGRHRELLIRKEVQRGGKQVDRHREVGEAEAADTCNLELRRRTKKRGRAQYRMERRREPTEQATITERFAPVVSCRHAQGGKGQGSDTRRQIRPLSFVQFSDRAGMARGLSGNRALYHVPKLALRTRAKSACFVVQTGLTKPRMPVTIK